MPTNRVARVRLTPWVTTLLIAASVAVLLAPGKPIHHPASPLSVLYTMFRHASWPHLLGGVVFLWLFGGNVEDRYGRLRYLVYYLLCGYVAGYGLVALHSTRPLVGASGAVSGVLGAFVVFFPRARMRELVPALRFLPARLPAWPLLGVWFALQWAYSTGYGAPGRPATFFASLVGFVFGVFAAVPLLRRTPPFPHQRSRGIAA